MQPEYMFACINMLIPSPLFFSVSLDKVDADGDGTINYDEFITATMHKNRMHREEHLYTAFQFFDKDNSGY